MQAYQGITRKKRFCIPAGNMHGARLLAECYEIDSCLRLSIKAGGRFCLNPYQDQSGAGVGLLKTQKAVDALLRRCTMKACAGSSSRPMQIVHNLPGDIHE
jgi:hypothetical protein